MVRVQVHRGDTLIYEIIGESDLPALFNNTCSLLVLANPLVAGIDTQCYRVDGQTYVPEADEWATTYSADMMIA